MLIRSLSGLAVYAGTAGMLSAQSPLTIPDPDKTTLVAIPRPSGPESSPTPVSPSLLKPQQTPSAVFPGTTIATPQPAAPAVPAKPAVPASLASQSPATDLLTTGEIGAVAGATACNVSCDPCGPSGRIWLDAGYWFGTVRGQNVPPLVTTAPPGTPPNQAGILGQPGTAVLFPTGTVNDDWRSGFYVNAGLWFDRGQKCGIEGNFFFLGTSDDQFIVASDGTTITSRPFIDATNGVQDLLLVSFPNIIAGSVTVDSQSNFIGGGLNVVRNITCGPCGRFDLLVGYSYLSLEDEINIREELTALSGQNFVPAGTRFLIQDNFRTSNSFNGVNLGISGEQRRGHWYFGLRAGVALGNVHQQVDINGNAVRTVPGLPSETFSGGLLAQPSNIGTFERDRFSAVPWFGLKVGLQVTPRVRSFIGYDFLYFSNVLRAGDQIDLRVNATQPQGVVTGPAFPTFTPRETGAAVNAFRFGIETRF